MSATEDPGGLTGGRYLVSKIRQHVYWARTQGLARLIEEDEIHPVRRTVSAYRKWRWRTAHGVAPGDATPVYVVGVQRSGTNMLVRGLEAAPEFEVHNENDRAAFHRFRLRDDAVIRRIVGTSRHRFVLFKPLCDSHRVDELLDGLHVGGAGRALWVYRSVDGRVRSAVAKFGNHAHEVMAAIAQGRGNHLWQAQGMSDDTRRELAAFDYSLLSAEDGAALVWWSRNRLYLERGLHQRDDVLLVSYDAFVQRPAEEMAVLCAFLGLPPRSEFSAHVAPREPQGGHRVALDPRVRELCDALADDLAVRRNVQAGT